MEIAEITLQRDWERLADAACAPLQQRWAYGHAMARLGTGVLRLRIRDGTEALGQVQLLCRRVCGIRISLGSRGPFWSGCPPLDTRAEAMRMLRQSLPGRLLLTTGEADAAPGQARFFPMMTQGTTAHLVLDDGMRGRMHGKWRNRLTRAEGAGLTVERLNPTRLDWLFDADGAAQRAKGYRALPRGVAEHWPDQVLTLAIKRNSRPLAAMLFLRHGTSATYHIGWSGDEGRSVSAHNLLLWRAMEELRAMGVEHLDLGMLDTVNAPGLARFKLGSGAKAHRLGGTWLGW